MKTSPKSLSINEIVPVVSRIRGALSLIIVLGAGLALPALGQVDSWAGAGGDGLWSDTLNWDGGVLPVNGNALVFTTTAKLNNTNNINSLLVNGITFNGTGFALYQAPTNTSGDTNNAITNVNGVLDTVGGNTLNIIQTMTGPETFTNNGSGTTVFGSSITNNGFNLTATGSGSITFNGVIGGTNTASTNYMTGGVIYTGTGTMRMAAANTFGGGVTNSDGGIVQLGNNSAIPSGATKGDVHLIGSTLDMDGFSPTLNGLYGDAASTINNSAGGSTYTITVGNNATNPAGVFDGNITVASGTVALTKINTNSFTLNGSAAYTGPTTISAGTFIVGPSGGLNGSTNIIVSPGALLDVSAPSSGLTLSYGALVAGRATNPAAGVYDINGSIVNDAGPMVVYSAGKVGTETINGSLTVNGIMQFDLANTTTVGSGVNDLVIINGTLTLGTGTIVLTPSSGSFLSGGTYTLISNMTGAAVSGPVTGLTAATPRGATATFAVDSHNNLTVTISGTGTAGNLVWAGNATLANWDVNTSEDWVDAGTSTPDFFFNLDNVTFNDPGNPAVNVATGVSPGSTTVNSTTNAYVFSGSGLISGSGNFTKTGTNVVTFETPNSYLGDTIIDGGVLILGIQVGAASSASFFNIDVYNSVTSGNLWLNGGGIFMSGQANTTFQANFNNVEVGPGDNSINSRTRQSSSQSQVQIQQIVRNGVGGTLDIDYGQKTASPQVGVMITNTATVNGILGGWATYNNTDWLVPEDTGEGAINLGNEADGTGTAANYQTSATPSAWGATSNINLSSAATAPITASATINSLKILSASVTNNSGVSLTLLSGGLLMPNATGTASSIVGGTLLGATNADLIVNQWNAASTLTIGSVIADNTNGAATQGSALTKSGQGTLILTGANTYTGPTFVNGFSQNGTPSGAAPAWFAASTLQIGAGGTSGSISNSSYITNAGTVIFDRTDTAGYSGPIYGIGGVKQIGSGTTVLSGDNTYSGITTISAGTLQIGTGGAAGSISNSISVANSGQLVYDRSSTRTYGGTISGAGSVINVGSGTTVLNGTNTYSGPTIITGGTLALGPTGSISNSTLVSNVVGTTFDVSAAGGLTLSAVGAGQTLAINGNVNGNVTNSGGNTIISPGGSGTIGTATFNNNLTLSGGEIAIDVNYPAWDAIVVNGTLTLDSGAVSLNNLGGTIPNGTYLLASAGSIAGSAGELIAPALGQSGQIDYLTNTPTGLYLVVASGVGANLTWIGDGANNFWDVTNTADWNNGSGAAVFHNGDYVTFNDTGDANSTVDVDVPVGPGAITNNSEIDYTFEGAGRITLGASLTKLDTDNLNIQTLNDYSGYTAILGGTINVGNGTTSGSIGTGPVTNDAALVFNIPDVQSIAGAMSGTGSLTIQSGEVNLTGNNSAYSGPITINNGMLQVGASLPGGGTTGSLGTGLVVDNTLLAFNLSTGTTYAGSITGAGVVSNSGLGAITLSGSNAYSGNTIVSQGTIKVGSPTAIPSGIGSGNVELDQAASGPSGLFDLNGGDAAINGLQGSVGTGTSSAEVANNAGTATHTLIIGTGGATASYSGQIVDNTGSGGKLAILVEGGATQTFDIENAVGNTYSGGTIISNATLTLNSPSGGGATPPYPNASSTALGSGPITLYNGTLNVVGSQGQSTSPTWSPGLGNTVIVPTNQIGTVNGCQRGPFSPTLQGSGTFIYGANYVRDTIAGDWSKFTGQVYWVEGAGANGTQLGIASTNGFYKVFVTNAIVFYNTVSGTPTIPFGELTDDGTSTLEAATSGNASGVAANFAVGSANTSTNFGGSIIDAVGIVKVGTGSWTLYSPTLTYTGETVVSNGILVYSNVVPTTSTPWIVSAPGILDVSIPGTLSVGASTDQTLLGNGLIRGNLTAGPDAVVQVGGAGIGTLSVTGGASLSGAVTMKLNITNGVQTNDTLSAASIALGGTLTVNNIGPTLQTGDSFKLFSTASLSGGFSGVSLPANNGAGVNYTWDTNALATTGTIALLSGGSLVNTNSTNLTFSVSAGQLTLSWPSDQTGWTLQTQTNADGLSTIEADWVDVAGSTATNSMSFSITTNTKSAFFRLVYP